MYSKNIENSIEKSCPKIASILNEIIPEEWEKIFLYAEVHDFSAKVPFYYYNINNEPIYSLDISKKFNIDERYIHKLTLDLIYNFKIIRDKFEELNEEKWTSATFILDNTGKMKLNFSYEKLSEDNAMEDFLKWRKKYIKGLNSSKN